MMDLGWKWEKKMVRKEVESGARKQKAMYLMLGNLNLSPRLLFHKVSIHLGAFFKRHILGSRYSKLASLCMKPRAGFSIA